MSDKEPMLGQQPSAPPPYGASQPPPYGYPPPPQPSAHVPPSYGATHTNVTIVQGQPVESRVFVEVKPSNYLIMSIITMIFFCFIFGLIALFVGMQVDSAWAAGDREGSQRYSSAARGWNIAGMVVGVVLYVCIIIGAVVGSVV